MNYRQAIDNMSVAKTKQLANSEPTQPDSPCIALCDTLYKDICTGCGRHYIEVAQWNSMSQTDKDTVWKRIKAEGTAKRFTTYFERAKP